MRLYIFCAQFPSIGHEELENSYGCYKSRQLKDFESFLNIFKKAIFQFVERMLMQTLRLLVVVYSLMPVQTVFDVRNVYPDVT